MFLVSGVVRDSTTSGLLPGANIFVENNPFKWITDKNGKFEINFNHTEKTATIIFSFIGYKTRKIIIDDNKSNMAILLQRDIVNAVEVVITESRIPQYILESPVTMIKVDSKKIKELPNENVYSGLATQKGVEVITNSLFYKSLNLRGFATSYQEGVLQLVDGTDINSPGQGFSFGNLTGANDIDIENIEIIPGAASAIYGPNAFNGLMNVSTKDPFYYQGLSAQFKSGCNYIDNTFHSTAFFSDCQLRYAKAFKERFAFKINAGYLIGDDWIKTSQTDFDGNATDETRGINNPGRDISNIYGDGVQQGLPIGPNGTLVNVSRTGWNAHELSSAHTYNLKTGASLHYHLTKKTDLIYQFNYSLFNSDFGNQTWVWKNFSVVWHKLELKNDNYFIRLYTVNDHDGNSYDGDWDAMLMNGAWKTDSLWFNDYTQAYNGLVGGVPAADHDNARKYSDIGMPQAGSELFNQLFDKFREIPIGQGGCRNIDESGLKKFMAQYSFKNKIAWAEIILGLDFGWRKLYTEGTQLMDFPPPAPIHDNNYSGYLQVKKKMFNNKFNMLASLRLDKFSQNILSATPRLAIVYETTKNNFFRASFQTGTMNADPFFEYALWTSDNYAGVGGSPFAQDAYLLHERSFEYNSVMNFIDSSNAYLDQYGQDSINAAVANFKYLLKPSGLEYLTPQKIKTFEIGYQSLLLRNKLHIDVNIFFSVYEKMIGYAEVEIPVNGNPFLADSLNAAGLSFLSSDYIHMATGVNAKQDVLAGGVEYGIDYNFFMNYVLSANFTYQNENLNPDLDVGVFWMHSPKYKSNVSFSNPDLYKNLGFAINWRWTDAVAYNDNDYNPHIHNNLDAKNVFDAQVSCTMSKLNSVLRIGASNILNHYYLESANGVSVGGVYYFSIMYNVK